MREILVIKLGALGDFVLAFAPFAALRAAFPHARLTLLTTAPFRDLATRSPWFDRVLIDERPAWHDLPALTALRRRLRGYDFVVDLQTSSRSSRYYLLAGRPDWSGIAQGCSRPHDNPQRDAMHTIARQRDQLLRAGIAPVDRPDLTWLAEDGPRLDHPYAVLVPGAAPHRPAKRWPVERFATLAARLDAMGLHPVIAGSAADTASAATIREAVPAALDLTGRTDLPALAGLMARASLAIGNDTGPMHLAAMMGAPSLSLFSRESDPRLTAPLGHRPGQVRILRVPDLATLDTTRVEALAREMLDRKN
ncbi:glycosyltransferase family 9 protein [Acidomonas methanolica]|uniref:glycosyltransferase family 9 protein n=1 Tax=Acidomonas methanolica TaxID=437 RepID=UPI00211A06D2|nr:glycosyltransferase family 9 protein [Acidomonas methanolica]MCQ9156419.1 glycosyltransferase family 9 protein [Acidomonas methanolica]